MQLDILLFNNAFNLTVGFDCLNAYNNHIFLVFVYSNLVWIALKVKPDYIPVYPTPETVAPGIDTTTLAPSK